MRPTLPIAMFRKAQLFMVLLIGQGIYCRGQQLAPSAADNALMYQDPFLCHLFVWGLGRMPVDWLVRDIELAPWRHQPHAKA
jgi:hypothetical protein